jgi:thiamine-phosphate pyrophosphorylase
LGEGHIRGDWKELERIARTLSRPHRRRKPQSPRLPSLILVTDPERTPDPLALMLRLPRGAGMIYRAFGAPDQRQTAQALGRIARRRGVLLLIGADAVRVRGSGVHLPQRMAQRARALKARGLVVTAAAHDLPAVLKARWAGADAVLISPIFPSHSPSAGRPLGAHRFAALVRAGGLPAYALGGITTATARRLRGAGAAGLAGVEAFAAALRPIRT